MSLDKIDWDKVRQGIQLAIPLLKLLAQRTKTDLDDQAVAFLEVLVADPTAAANLIQTT